MSVKLRKQPNGEYHVYFNGYRSQTPMSKDVALQHKQRIQGGMLPSGGKQLHGDFGEHDSLSMEQLEQLRNANFKDILAGHYDSDIYTLFHLSNPHDLDVIKKFIMHERHGIQWSESDQRQYNDIIGRAFNYHGKDRFGIPPSQVTASMISFIRGHFIDCRYVDELRLIPERNINPRLQPNLRTDPQPDPPQPRQTIRASFIARRKLLNDEFGNPENL